MIYLLLWTSQLVKNLTSKSKPNHYITHSSILFGLESFTASSARCFLGKEESCKLKLCAMCIPPLELWNETKPSSLGEMTFKTCKTQVWNICEKWDQIEWRAISIQVLCLRVYVHHSRKFVKQPSYLHWSLHVRELPQGVSTNMSPIWLIYPYASFKGNFVGAYPNHRFGAML